MYRYQFMEAKNLPPGIGILDHFSYCNLDLDPMTCIYELHCIPSTCAGCVKMNFLWQGFRKLSFDVSQTYIQSTDRQNRII